MPSWVHSAPRSPLGQSSPRTCPCLPVRLLVTRWRCTDAAAVQPVPYLLARLGIHRTMHAQVLQVREHDDDDPFCLLESTTTTTRSVCLRARRRRPVLMIHKPKPHDPFCLRARRRRPVLSDQQETDPNPTCRFCVTPFRDCPVCGADIVGLRDEPELQGEGLKWRSSS